jgi:serine/threonine-protein kinase RsbW
MGDLEAPLDGPVELTLPADTRLVRLVRLVASGLASTAGFDVDDLDDLRIGVDEVLAALLEGGDGSPLSLRFRLDDSRIELEGETKSGGDPLEPDRLELSRQILEAFVDEHDLRLDGGVVAVRVSKRRSVH